MFLWLFSSQSAPVGSFSYREFWVFFFVFYWFLGSQKKCFPLVLWGNVIKPIFELVWAIASSRKLCSSLTFVSQLPHWKTVENVTQIKVYDFINLCCLQYCQRAGPLMIYKQRRKSMEYAFTWPSPPWTKPTMENVKFMIIWLSTPVHMLISIYGFIRWDFQLTSKSGQRRFVNFPVDENSRVIWNIECKGVKLPWHHNVFTLVALIRVMAVVIFRFRVSRFFSFQENIVQFPRKYCSVQEIVVCS